MLQLSGTLRNATSRLTPLSSWRVATQQPTAACSGVAGTRPVLSPTKDERPADKKPKENTTVKKVFDTLQFSKLGSERSRVADGESASRTTSSADVGGLLKMVEEKNITRENAHAAPSILNDWAGNGKAKPDDFERDAGFARPCAASSRSTSNGDGASVKEERNSQKLLDKLDFFYSTHETDETSKVVANLDVKQMIKIMTALAQQKKRTTPLLRSLVFNISRSGGSLDIKRSSDLLYSMAVLNYPDEVLLQKISNDLVNCVNETDKSAVIGSIVTSLGMLRYKNEQLIDVLSEWMVQHSNATRPQDSSSFLLTLAMLGYKPANLDALKEPIETLKESDMAKPADWLDVVWALTVLQLADNRHIASVLNGRFIRKLADSREITVPKKHKLLNINGIAATLSADEYDGPLLDNTRDFLNCPIQVSKEKQILAGSIATAIDNIFPSPLYSKRNVDVDMGFLLDAEFCVDRTGKRLPVESDLRVTKGIRIAVMALSYNDFCRGKQDPVGYYDLYFRALGAKGYEILTVPYTEFSTKDKIVQRILYIKNKINKIIAK